MVITEALRERIESTPRGMEVMVELSFPEGTPTRDVAAVGNRAIKHLFDWQPNGSAGTLGYQRDGFEPSYRYAGKIKGVRELRPFEELSEREREDREAAAAHIIQIWPDLQIKLAK